MANQSALQVDKIIITRQNPEALEPLPPSELEYGELAVDQAGKLYTADKDNNVVVAGGGEAQEWSEIDNQTAAEPPNPREADQLNGYKATDIIKEAVKQVSEIDILLPVEPDSPRQADQLEGYSVQAIVEKAVEAATLVDDLTPPEPETLKDADTLNGLSSEQIIENNGISLYTHSKVGTVHDFSGSGINGRAKMTANVETGDTFTVNGSPVTAYMGAESATDSMAGSTWSGKQISFVVDGEILNFKGGGGLSAADKAKLIPENIRSGVTIDKVTGTLTPPAPNTVAILKYPTSSVTSDPIHLSPGDYRLVGVTSCTSRYENTPNVSVSGVSGFSPVKTSLYGYENDYHVAIYDNVFSVTQEADARITISGGAGFRCGWVTITSSSEQA